MCFLNMGRNGDEWMWNGRLFHSVGECPVPKGPGQRTAESLSECGAGGDLGGRVVRVHGEICR